RRAAAFFQNLVLQPARGGFHSVFLFVVGQEFFTRSQIFRGRFFVSRGLFFHHFFREGLEGFVPLFLRHRLLSGQRILQSEHECVQVQIDILLFESRPNIVANSVALLVFYVFERWFVLR